MGTEQEQEGRGGKRSQTARSSMVLPDIFGDLHVPDPGYLQ